MPARKRAGKGAGRVLFEGKGARVVELKRIMPDGKLAERTVFSFGEAVVVLALNEDNDIVFERHYRAGADTWVYELPAGRLDRGELPDEAARRELLEEAGYKADELKELFEFYPMPGFSDYTIHAFIAKGRIVARQKLEEGEFIEVKAMALEQIMELIKDGEVEDAKTLAVVLFFNAFKKELLGGR